MDAFQCRMQFTRQISTLTASAVAAKQCAQFALKNRDFDEDLFSVIMEQLESVSPPFFPWNECERG
jgi:CTD kinase subunit gamma